jgi:hypothetical protein
MNRGASVFSVAEQRLILHSLLRYIPSIQHLGFIAFFIISSPSSHKSQSLRSFCKQSNTPTTSIAIMHLATTGPRQPLALINVSNHSAHSLVRLHRIKTSAAATPSIDSDDDCSSTSSTITVARQKPHQTSKNIKKKTVGFNEDNNVAYDNTTTCKEDCKDSCWYNAQDYAQFKASTKFLVREIVRNEKRHAKRSINSYQCVLERTYFDAEQQRNQNQYQLHQWMRVTTCRLGLERLAIRQIAVDRSQRRIELVESVLKLQGEHRYNWDCNDCNYATNAAEILRQASESYSRPSRQFARHLAVALQDSTVTASSC